MTERDKLIEDINSIYWKDYPYPKLGLSINYSITHQIRMANIADFIIEDRKRILVNIKHIRKELNELILPTKKENRLIAYCDETLKLAGVEHES